MAAASDKVFVNSIGSGQMTVVGSCKEFKAEQTGSGDLDAEHLSADDVNQNEPARLGHLDRPGAKVADVNLRGSGEVRHPYGSPDTRNVSRTGSGEVNFRQ
jgi:hypothetical protein